MKFILIIFMFTADPNAPVGVMHKAFPNQEACESAQAELKEKMKLPDGFMAAAKCISEKDLVEFEMS